MTAKSKLVQTINEGSESHDFGVVDSKGRAIGARITLKVQVLEAAPADANSYYPREPGTYYVASVQATRAGVGYGASFNGKVCTSEAERIAYVENYLKSAKARAVKTAAKK